MINSYHGERTFINKIIRFRDHLDWRIQKALHIYIYTLQNDLWIIQSQENKAGKSHYFFPPNLSNSLVKE